MQDEPCYVIMATIVHYSIHDNINMIADTVQVIRIPVLYRDKHQNMA